LEYAMRHMMNDQDVEGLFQAEVAILYKHSPT